MESTQRETISVCIKTFSLRRRVKTRIILHLGVYFCRLCIHSGALIPLTLEKQNLNLGYIRERQGVKGEGFLNSPNFKPFISLFQNTETVK